MFDVKSIKRYKNYIERKVRDFLLSPQCKESLTFLFFVLVAFAFWLLQILDNTYQTEFKVPLRLKNVPKEVVMTSELPGSVRVKIEDRGTALLNYMLGRSFLPVTFDFRDYADAGTHVRISSSELQKKIAAQLNVSTKLITVRPDTLGFVYTRGKAHKIPVRVNASVQAGQQYYVSAIRLNPDSVTAYAPEEILDTLSAAMTQKISLDNVTDSVKLSIGLEKMAGVKFVPASTDVSVYVDMYSEKTVEVPVTGMNFPAGKILRTFPSKVQVTFQVGLKQFKEVQADDFFIGITYEDVLRTKGDKLYLSVKGHPDFVNHIRITPETVDYLIEQQSVADE